MIAQALAACVFAASQTYAVPPAVILGVLHVEGGRVGQAVKNTNGTFDLGPMQINTIWMPELAREWNVPRDTALRWVRDDACVNVGVGTWILRKKMNETGSLMKGISYYHSATPHLGKAYRARVIGAMSKYRLIQKPGNRQMAQQKPAPRHPG